METRSVVNPPIQLRGVVFCISEKCLEAYRSQLVLLPERRQFRCPEHDCQQEMVLVLEEYEVQGNPEVFRQVRVEWDYEPKEQSYRGVVVLTDETIDPRFGTYVLRCPLVKTEARATKMASNILSNLHKRTATPDRIMFHNETTLSVDDPREKFFQDCAALGKVLASSNLVGEVPQSV